MSLNSGRYCPKAVRLYINSSRIKWVLIFVMSFFLVAPPTAKGQINTDNVILMGRHALSLDDYLTAIHYFNQVIEVKPHLSEPYYLRAYAKFSLEDYSGAEADCDASIRLNPYVADLYLLRGLCRIHNKDYQGAVADYTKALSEEPDNQGAIYNRALCRLELKDFETADKDMDYLLSKWKNFQRAYMIKAQIAMEQKDTVRGIAWIDSLIHINPNEEQAWAFKGRYALNKEDFKLADSCFSQAIRIQPGNYEHYVLRAQARHGMNRFGQALEDYDKTIELIPEHFIAHYNRGLLRALVGDNNRAIEDFNFVIEQEPDNTLAIYNRAQLKEVTGDYRGAIKDYTTLIKSYPNFIYGYMARANCRKKIGDYKGAKNDESVVEKAHLDMTYQPNKRKPIKKVRLRNEHSLDQYQQLVEENPDTTRTYIHQLIGKVQNRHAEIEILPMFALGFRTEPQQKEYRKEGFLPEVDRINKMRIIPVKLTFEATNQYKRNTEELEHTLKQLEKNSAKTSEQYLIRSILHAELYNFEKALSMLDSAQYNVNNTYLCHMLRANYIVINEKNQQAAPLVKGEKNSTSPEEDSHERLMQLAIAEIDKAIMLSPQNAYLLYNRGCLKAKSRNYDGAITDFCEAIHIDPQLAEAYYNRAVIYLLRGETEKAIPDLSFAGQRGLYKAYNLLKQAHANMQEGNKTANEQ